MFKQCARALVLSLYFLSSRPPAPGTSLSKLSGAHAVRLQISHASYHLLSVKEVASPKPPKPVPPCPHPGFLAPRGASWMAGDGFTRLDLIGGCTTAN